MNKNPIARKLALYFGAALLAFALVIGSLFAVLFRRHAVQMHKQELEQRALSISKPLSDFLGGSGGMGLGAYLRFISDIAGTDAWVVDSNMNLLTMGGKGHMGGSAPTYAELPANADSIIRRVLAGDTVFSQDFSGLLSEPVLTVGVPVYGTNGQVLGAVLLHSPVRGTNEAVQSGLGILAISLLVGLVLSLVLSVWLSKNFTDPIILKEAEDALRMDKLRQDFVANISHELKTPITVMRGSLEALTDKVVTEPQMVEEYHRQMLKETTHLQRLVGDLLDLSKLQNTDFVMEKQQVDVQYLLAEAVRSAQQMASVKGVHITQHCDATFTLWGDYGRLRQMLMIVLDNAIKFSPPGGAVAVQMQQGVLTVCDSGPGVPPEEAPYIFDRFYKARTGEYNTGSGLGLAIAGQIAQRHGINLSLVANSPQGACFGFDFRNNAKSL